MYWLPWPKTDCAGIARYVNPELITDEMLPPGHLRRRLRASRKYDELVRLIYKRLCELNIQYTDSLTHYNPESQRIRSPKQIISEYKEGTCLDLATLFCSVCLSCKLLPALIITERHAFAAVSLEHEYQNLQQHKSQRYNKNGFIDLEQLQTLVAREGYLLIECTGFANGAEDGGYAELRAANNDFLPFEAACEIGKERLTSPDRIMCIADIATLHALEYVPLPRELSELPSLLAEAVYNKVSTELIAQSAIEERFSQFEEALGASLAAAIKGLGERDDFNMEAIKTVASFVQLPEVQQSFADLLFEPEKKQKLDFIALQKALESDGVSISTPSFDKMMAALLEGFDRASLQFDILNSVRTTQLLKQLTEDIRSGRVEAERQRYYQVREATVRKKAQEWLERNPRAQELLDVKWGELLLSVYPFVLAGFASESTDMDMFVDWLEWRGLKDLAQYTREVMPSVIGPSYDVMSSSGPWFANRANDWNVEIDKLLEIVDFIWLRLISQALASTTSGDQLDLLFEIRLYAETQQNPRLVFRTSNIAPLLLKERNLDTEKLQQRWGDLGSIIRSYPKAQQIEKIHALIYENPEPHLRQIGFYTAEDLFALSSKNLRPCWPLPSQLEMRTGYSHWPLACDIEDGRAVKTEAYATLQQYITQGNIVLLYGKWGNGKTTCARLFAYDWLKANAHKGTILYFGNLGNRSEVSLIEAYAKFPTREVIDLVRKTANPLIILDDIQYGFEVVESFVREFQNEFNDKNLVLISTTFDESMSGAGERLFNNYNILRVPVKLDVRDVQRLIRAYWPPTVHRKPEIPRREEADAIQRRALRDWSLLHIYITKFDEEQFKLLAENKTPRFGKAGLKREFFDIRFSGLSQEVQHTVWELCALGTIQLPILEGVVRQNREWHKHIQQLLSNGYLVKQALLNFNNSVAYTLHLPRLASYYLQMAEESGLLFQMDALPDEPPVTPPYPTISIQRLTVRALARYLLSRPGNYSHVFLLAFTNRREDLLQLLIARSQPWHRRLLNQLIEACNSDSSPVQIALTLNLLARINRSLPRELLEQHNPRFNDSRLITQLQKRVNSQANHDVMEAMLALRYLRQADRDWSRNRIVTAVVPLDVLAGKLLQSPLHIASQLFAEVYRLKPSYARSVLERMVLVGQREGIRMRVISALGVDASSKEDVAQIAHTSDTRLIEITSFLDSLALADHTWINELLVEIGYQPFTRRILLGVEPAILSVSVGQLFRVSPSFVYGLYDQWRQTPDIMLTLAASFAAHTQRFSKTIRSLRDLAETMPKLARHIFDLISIAEWKRKWNGSPYISEFNSGFRNLLSFYPDGASRLLAAFSTDELVDALHLSVTPGLTPYFLSGLLLILADLRPGMVGEFLQKFELSKIINIFRSEGARLPSVALLIAGLTHVKENDEQVLQAWNQLRDYVDRGLFGDAAPVDIARFYVYLKNNFFPKGYAQVRSEIATSANTLIEQGMIKTIVEEAGDLTQTGQLLNSIGYWSEHDLIEQFVHKQEHLLNERLKRSRDVTDIGNFLRVVGKFASRVHARLVKNLRWDFIIEDIHNEFKLGRVVILLEGLLAFEDMGEHVVEFDELSEGVLSTSQLELVKQKLMPLCDDFIAQIDDEPNLSTINNLLFALWRISPEITDTIIEKFDRDRLLSRLRAEPRISVICKMLSGLSRINGALMLWLTEKLGEQADSLNIKLFLESRLDLFALDLYRLHGGELASLAASEMSTAEKMLSAKSFDWEELRERFQREQSNLNVAALLYNLSIINKAQAKSILDKMEHTNRWLRHRPLPVQPETVALLFALRLVAPRYARTFAEHLLAEGFPQAALEQGHDVRFIAWAIRELGITLGNDQNWGKFVRELPWSEITGNLIYAWHNKRQISVWELGWCLWALGTTNELRAASAVVRQGLLSQHGSQILEQIELVQQPIHRAFGLLGFGVELARSYRYDWLDLARDLTMRLPDAPGNILIYNEEKDNSLLQIAQSVGMDLELEGESELNLENVEVLESYIWSYCWRWFHFGVFSNPNSGP